MAKNGLLKPQTAQEREGERTTLSKRNWQNGGQSSIAQISITANWSQLGARVAELLKVMRARKIIQ